MICYTAVVTASVSLCYWGESHFSVIISFYNMSKRHTFTQWLCSDYSVFTISINTWLPNQELDCRPSVFPQIKAFATGQSGVSVLTLPSPFIRTSLSCWTLSRAMASHHRPLPLVELGAKKRAASSIDKGGEHQGAFLCPFWLESLLLYCVSYAYITALLVLLLSDFIVLFTSHCIFKKNLIFFSDKQNKSIQHFFRCMIHLPGPYSYSARGLFIQAFSRHLLTVTLTCSVAFLQFDG